MKRRPLGGLILVALGLAPLSLVAQQDTPDVRKPFRQSDDKPIPRAIPVEKPIPRAIPVEKPGASPAPNTVAPPKPMAPPEPSEPGDIKIAPQEKGTPDVLQLQVADTYYAKKQYDMAAPEYERYLGQYANAPDRATAYFRLGECYRHIGNNNSAKNAYETLLGQYGTGDFVGPASYRLADLYYQEKQFRDALTLYRKASVRLKEPAVANAAKFFTGRCLEALGQKLEARVAYEDLVSQPKDNPFYDASRLSLALLLKDSARTAEAIKQIQALAKQTENPDLKLEATVRAGLWSLDLDPPLTAQADAEFKAALALPGKGYWKELAQLGQVRILSDSGKFPQVLGAYEKMGKDVSAEVKPELLLLAANALRQTNKVPDALNLYDQVTKEFPGSVYDKEAQYERLRTMYAASDEALIGEIDKYLAANPEAQKRDEALLMKAEVLFKKEDFENAMPIYSTLELSRQLTGNRKAEALFRLGWCQLQTKNIEQAIKTFTSFINGYPTHKLLPFALLQRGLAYQSLKNLTGALKDYDTIIKGFPKAPQRELAFQQQALIQGQQGNNSGMAASFRQLVKEFPETAARAQANYWIGWAAFEAKSYKDAVAPLEDARQLDKEQFGEKSSIRILLSDYYLEDKTATAREVDRYSKEGKTKVPPEILRWLGKSFHDGGSHESAEKYLLLLTPRDEAMPEDFLLLAQSQLAIQKFQPAADSLQAYLKATKLPVPRCKGLLLLAKAQIGLGAQDLAQKTVDEALTLQPEGEWSGRARIVAGDIQMSRKNFEEAAKVFESVAVILDDPEITPEALEKAVAAWRAAGKTAEAEKTLNKLKSRYPEYKTGKFAGQ
ncbi:MAG: tetratricopeptide repeat protein [Chthoniobacter sp.]|uniref:tetratricopeptide repeat protein n=1 Tax=Chthoniobacter sp. TaxID=2510640 RepID=UPI0032A41584